MATRSHTTFKKRQREMARVEKQLEKVAKRQRKKEEESQPPDPDATADESGASFAELHEP